MIRKDRLKGIWVDYVVAGQVANWPQIKVRFKGHSGVLGSIGIWSGGRGLFQGSTQLACPGQLQSNVKLRAARGVTPRGLVIFEG